MDEFQLIKKYLAPLAAHKGAFGLKDDAALLPEASPGRHFIWTTDTLIEDVHFLSDDPLDDVARKLIRVNVSDCLAKGAYPKLASLALSWPRSRDEAAFATFCHGLKEELQTARTELLGGDTSSTSGPLSLTLSLIGETLSDKMITRSTAKAGDDLWLTGDLGAAGFGLKLLRGEDSFKFSAAESQTLKGIYQASRPNLPDRAQIVSEYAHAAMDVSDGLVQDAGHLAEASGVQAEIDLDLIPLHPALQRIYEEDQSKSDILSAAISFGDDYQILFSAPQTARKSLGLKKDLTLIGRVCGDGHDLQTTPIVLKNAPPGFHLESHGFRHFTG